MNEQLYIKKGRKYIPIDNNLSQYEEDCIWMSYRYCIGRHTIAAHMHAGNIASHAYGRMSDDRTQFMSEDINREIAHILNVHNWFEFDNEWNIPKSEYRPLDLLYRCLDEANITSDEELRRIKNITAFYKDGQWMFDIHYYKHGDNVRSLSDLQDLEVWQQLANLFDLKGHKMCRLIDDTFCEYYECWKHYRKPSGECGYKMYRIPVDAGFSVLTYIPDESIAEDNVQL
jgi:hypothetical protein